MDFFDQSRRKTAFHIVLLCLVGLIAYANTFDAEFHFDDYTNIVTNPLIRDLGSFFEGGGAAGTGRPDIFNRRYVGFFTFALNYHLHGFDVTGYHLLNILIHIINAVLVYSLMLLSFQTPVLKDSRLSPRGQGVALIAAMLFLVHPIQTQAVTYVVQRFASLATLFCLGSFVAYICSRLAGKPPAQYGLYALSLLSAVLAMKTKEIAFTLPVTVLLYEVLFFRRLSIRRFLSLLPLLLTMLLIPLSIMGTHGTDGALSELADETLAGEIPRGLYFMNEFRVMLTYLRLLALPVNQVLDYEYVVHDSFFFPQIYLSFFTLLCIVGLGVWLVYISRSAHRSEWRLVAFGIFWFFITLAVESTVVSLYPIFEHRLYLSSIGLFFAFAVAGASYISYMEKRRLATLARSGVAVIIALLLLATIARNNVWSTERSLWEDEVAKYPNNPRAHQNLGVVYQDMGLYDKAKAEFLASVALNPGSALAHLSLGNLYLSAGDAQAALRSFQRVVALDPNNADAYNNIGVILYDAGRVDEAIANYRKAIELDPDHADAYNNIGVILFSQGDYEQAYSFIEHAVRLDPTHAKASENYQKLRGFIEMQRKR